MAQFNKEFYYRGYRFNTSVELNTTAERRPNGKVWHTVVTNCMDGGNFYRKEDVVTDALEGVIELHRTKCREYIDKLNCNPKTKEELLLTSLGFS